MRKYLYELLFRYLSVYIKQENSLLEINPRSLLLAGYFKRARLLFLDRALRPSADMPQALDTISDIAPLAPEYILLNGDIHYQKDIHAFLVALHTVCASSTRLVITYYSSVWKPLARLATVLGLREKAPEQNWITHQDIVNLLSLADFEPVLEDCKIICPVYIPLLSNLLNRYIAPLPFFRSFCLVNILVARPLTRNYREGLSVSVIVPARNEEGNIENIVRRLPKMGPKDELIFVEGNSTDGTWAKIEEVREKYKGLLDIKSVHQQGRGKGDAVRKGFDLASRDILMILDADLTVAPEDLPAFYSVIVSGKGEFINGSRLVYPMADGSMRFFNMIGNKFFAMAFSYVLGQRFKVTLCGTKVISKDNYTKLAAYRHYFGDFDPFGDFDLIFGAVRLCLKVRELPVRYSERTYGSTNIRRWKHGAILLGMLTYASRKIKFI